MKTKPTAVAFTLASVHLAEDSDEGMFLAIEAGPDGVTLRLYNSGLTEEPELALTHAEFLRAHAVIANACEIFQLAKQEEEERAEFAAAEREQQSRRPGKAKRFQLPQ